MSSYHGGQPPGVNGNSYIHDVEQGVNAKKSTQTPQEEWTVTQVDHVEPTEVVSIHEPHGDTLDRVLDANQATMIAIGGTFGTGLLVGSGQALHEGGPLGVLIAYAFVCGVCYCMMTGLCEMATFLPHKKGFVGLISRYVHPAVGFSVGWSYLCQYLIVPALLINTAAIVVKYSAYTLDVNGNPVGNLNPVAPAVWRFIFIATVVGVNFFPTRVYGQFEFWQSTFKILILITLIVYGLVVDLGGAPLKTGGFQRLGFLFWGFPNGPFGHPQGEGDFNTFLGFWSVMVHALFSLMGIEQIGVAVGEIKNPRRSIPQAVKRTYRIVLTLYMLGIIIVGLICSSNDFTLTSPDPDKSRGGLASPFVIAANRLAINGLVPVISAAIIMFAISCATSTYYTGSRVLYGLALDGQAPAVFGKVVAGRPMLALAVSAAFCFLSYMGQDEENPATAFFSDMTTSMGGIIWSIIWAHIRFRQALSVKGYDIDALAYRSPIYPYGTWLALIATIIITTFQGYEAYATGRGAPGLVAAYIFIPVSLFLFGGWKIWHNLHATPLSEIDLLEGKAEIDLDEQEWERHRNARPTRSWLQRSSNAIWKRDRG